MSTFSSNDTIAQIDAIRKAACEAGGQYLTNLFVPLPLVQEGVASGRIAELVLPGRALLLLEPLSNGKRQLSFVASSPVALAQCLAHFRNVWEGDTVCNLVGEKSRIADLIALFEQVGFLRHGFLRRMTRMPRALPQATVAAAPAVVRLAKRSDCESIRSALEATFDPWSEPVPTQEATLAAIDAGEISLVTAQGSSCEWDALFWAERRGRVNTTRFWLRHPDSGSKGAAGALMRSFLEESDGKIVRLWVMADNQNGIDRYCHYGFDFDAVETAVIISRKEQ